MDFECNVSAITGHNKQGIYGLTDPTFGMSWVMQNELTDLSTNRHCQ